MCHFGNSCKKKTISTSKKVQRTAREEPKELINHYNVMMAPPRTMATIRTLPATMTTTQLRGIVKKSSKEVNSLQNLYKKYINIDYFKYLIFDPAALPVISLFIIAAEIILNFVIITRVSYTEIDWIAYMQECEGFLNGTTNYALLKGDTGPLVYPSAFLYIYSALYFITSRGQNIRLAQYIFAIVYLIQMWLVLRLYTKSRKVPPYALALSAFTSYRIHSIYVLRLFNDPLAMLFLYAALNLFIERRWTFGSCLYSLAVGTKMNILLFAPALLLFYITSLGYRHTFQQLAICGTIQLILGAPFLLTYPWAYLRGSFDLGRVFEHKWTVNYRFLDRTIFEHIFFHLTLLVLHLVLLAACAKPAYIYIKNYVRLRELQTQLQPQIDRQNEELSKHSSASKQKNVLQKQPEQVKKVDDEKLTHEQEAFLKSFEKCLQKSSGLVVPNQSTLANNASNEDPSESNSLAIHFDQCSQLALLPLFFCNFIGVMCARSLHYQFYVWYFHSLPYLAWSTNYSLTLRFLLLGLIEMCWNTYPSTNFSSLTLHCCHLMLFVGVIRNMLKTMELSSTTLNSQLRKGVGCTKDTKKSKTK